MYAVTGPDFYVSVRGLEAPHKSKSEIKKILRNQKDDVPNLHWLN